MRGPAGLFFIIVFISCISLSSSSSTPPKPGGIYNIYSVSNFKFLNYDPEASPGWETGLNESSADSLSQKWAIIRENADLVRIHNLNNGLELAQAPTGQGVFCLPASSNEYSLWYIKEISNNADGFTYSITNKKSGYYLYQFSSLQVAASQYPTQHSSALLRFMWRFQSVNAQGPLSIVY